MGDNHEKGRWNVNQNVHMEMQRDVNHWNIVADRRGNMVYIRNEKDKKEKYKGNKKGFIKYLLVAVFIDWIELICIPILFLILSIVFILLG